MLNTRRSTGFMLAVLVCLGGWAARGASGQPGETPQLLGHWAGFLTPNAGQPTAQTDFEVDFTAQRGSRFAGNMGPVAMQGLMNRAGHLQGRTVVDRGTLNGEPYFHWWVFQGQLNPGGTQMTGTITSITLLQSGHREATTLAFILTH
jgi:hypothetical protein